MQMSHDCAEPRNQPIVSRLFFVWEHVQTKDCRLQTADDNYNMYMCGAAQCLVLSIRPPDSISTVLKDIYDSALWKRVKRNRWPTGEYKPMTIQTRLILWN